MTPDKPQGLLPGLPGGWRGQSLLALVLAAVIVVDRIWLQGVLFGSRAWSILRWVIAGSGFLVGSLAYLGRLR